VLLNIPSHLNASLHYLVKYWCEKTSVSWLLSAVAVLLKERNSPQNSDVLQTTAATRLLQVRIKSYLQVGASKTSFLLIEYSKKLKGGDSRLWSEVFWSVELRHIRRPLATEFCTISTNRNRRMQAYTSYTNSQVLIFRAYRHRRAWRSEIRAWMFGNPCLKFWQCFIITVPPDVIF